MQLYRNPIARAGDFADPFVLRHDGRYYLYCTNPDVRCWSSGDLVKWRLEGATIAEDVFPGLVPFAPEVVYTGGAFYMYTSPSGQGHTVLRSDAPTGPFVPVSGNLGHAIDGNVLIDDDGRSYFYWAGDEGIWGCEMSSPTGFGEPVFTGIHMNGWTEGPFVGKRDGVYWMTLTGNHYLSSGYRIDAAWSDSPLTGYRADPLNPVLVSATGPLVGLGHSSTVIGPDLVSTWMAYHNINPDASRDLDLDRQVWSGRSLQVLGPSAVAPAPAAPDEWCDWDAAGAARWTGTAGRVEIRDSAGVLTGEGVVAVWDVDPGDTFTAELNLTGDGHGLMLDGTPVPLPAHLDAAALHCWRVVADGGLRVSVDGFDTGFTAPGACARLGVVAGASPLRIGHVALTRTVAAIADRRAVKPVPGRFWASLGAGGAPLDAGDHQRMLLKTGDEAVYDVEVSEAGAYRIHIVGEFGPDDALDAGDDQRLLTGGSGVLATTADLPQGRARIVVRCRSGAPVLDLVTVTGVPATLQAAFADELQEGYGKRLLGDGFWADVDIDATLRVELAAADAHADLLVRASQPSEGGEGGDARLGIDFLLGYSVQLHRDRVVLARHAYDERVLATHPVPIDAAPHRLRLRVRGGGIAVELDGRSLFEAHDPLPHPVGAVGLRTSNARLHVDRLEVAADAAISTPAAATSGPEDGILKV